MKETTKSLHILDSHLHVSTGENHRSPKRDERRTQRKQELPGIQDRPNLEGMVPMPAEQILDPPPCKKSAGVEMRRDLCGDKNKDSSFVRAPQSKLYPKKESAIDIR